MKISWVEYLREASFLIEVEDALFDSIYIKYFIAPKTDFLSRRGLATCKTRFVEKALEVTYFAARSITPYIHLLEWGKRV